MAENSNNNNYNGDSLNRIGEVIADALNNFNNGNRILAENGGERITREDFFVTDKYGRSWSSGQRVQNQLGYGVEKDPDTGETKLKYYKYKDSGEKDKKATKEYMSKEAFLEEKHRQEMVKVHKIMAKRVLGIITAVTDGVMEITKAWYDYNINTTKKSIEATQKMAKSNFNMFGKSMNQSIKNAFNGIGQTATATSYASANAQMAQANAFRNFQFEKNIIAKQADYDIRSERVKAITRTIGAVTTAVGAIAGSVVPVAGNAAGAAIGAMVGVFIGKLGGKLYTMLADFKLKRIALDIDERKSIQEKQQEVLNFLKEQGESVLELSKKNEEKILKIDKTATDLIRTFGYGTSQTENARKQVFEIATKISDYGKTTEDFVKIQSDYISRSGRAVSLNASDASGIFATAMNFGISDTEASSIFGGMNIFNTSIADGVDQLHEMRKIANKIGISSNKFAKDLTKNLELAQKYNFKGGVDGMMKMTMWAEKTRFNMQNLTSLIDNLMDGNIENTLSTSAKLQVLGGNAAIFSDPLGMQYDAGADPESLAKRMYNSFKGYGTFNRTTGETTFNWGEDAMIRNIAKAYGMSHEDAKKMIREQNKSEDIKKQLNGVFTDEEIAGITSKALYDKKSKSWKVNMLDGKVMDVGSLTSSDIENLVSNDVSDNAAAYAKETMDVTTKQLAVQYNIEAMLAKITGTDIKKLIEERMEANRANYITGSGENETINDIYSGAAISGSGFANKSQSEQFKIQKNAIKSGVYKDYMEYTLSTTENIIKGQNELTDIISLLIKANNGDMNAMRAAETKFAEMTGNVNIIKKQEKANKLTEKEARKEAVKRLRNEAAAEPFPMRMNDGAILPLNDGTVVQTDPNDTILAAKNGGPFDTLFKGVFNKIDGVERILSNGTLNVGVNGKIELTSGGKSVDITNEMAHELSKVLLSEISKNANGGRGELFPNRYAGVGKF